jgi:hypothetical protein
MARHFDEIDSFERNGFTVIVDKTYEDIDPWDQLSECFDDKKQLYADIESGKYDWFMLRVRLMVDEYEITSEWLGGCLYENPREVLTDGTVDDLIATAMITAKREVYRMYKKFQDISWEHDAEGINV